MLNLHKNNLKQVYLIETNNYLRTKQTIIDFAISIGFNKQVLLSNNSLDFNLIEVEDIIKVDFIREKFINTIYFAPRFEDKKIYLIYDSSLMNLSSQNALLKTLEELPQYVVVFFVALNIKKILDTIKSRCIIYYDYDNNINVEKYEQLEYFYDFIKSICDIKYGLVSDFVDLLNKIDETKESKKIIKIYIDLLYMFFHDLIVYKKTLNKEYMLLQSISDISITFVNSYSEYFFYDFIEDLNKIKLLQDNNLDYKMILIDLYIRQKKRMNVIRR